MPTYVPIVILVYFSIINISIGLYIGYFGSDFVRPNPIAYLIGFIATGGGFLLLYFQNTFGYTAQPEQIGITLIFFVIGYIIGYYNK